MIIPADLDRWHPNEVQDWLTDLENDESVADAEIERARQAAHLAIVGEPAAPAKRATGSELAVTDSEPV